VGAALAIGAQIGGPAGQAVIAAAKSAFIHAMDRGLEVGGAVALLGALVAALWLPNRAEPAPAAQSAPEGGRETAVSGLRGR